MGTRAVVTAALSGGLLLLQADPASARSRGIAAQGCSGCHGAPDAALAMSSNPSELAPDQEATFTVSIRSDDLRSGGVFIESGDTGQLRALAGEGLSLVSAGLTHSQPKPAQNGEVTFRFAWRAPATPGGVTFKVYAIAANDDGRSSGDLAADDAFDWVFGCEGQTFYRDADSDGFGGPLFKPLLRCAGAPPQYFSAVNTDCDDNRAETYPGAVEKCNLRDDNCNETIDEDAQPVELWPDEDGDGYYQSKSGEPIMGCVPTAGYAAESGDCDPRDPAIHRDAEEICNLRDDNCDTRVDERVRPQCGIGYCAANSPTCAAEDCRPNKPMAEHCNLLDDDCNGEIDEGDLCASGLYCISGECLSETNVGNDGAPGAGVARRDLAPAGCGCSTSGVSRTGFWCSAIVLLFFAMRSRPTLQGRHRRSNLRGI